MTQTPFVGRADEVARLQRELVGVRDGARLVLVRGDAGVGKTRLLVEFQTLVRPRATCLVGRGSPLGGSVPFSVVAEALESHLRSRPMAELTGRCGPRVAALREILPSFAVAIAASAPSQPSRLETFEAFICLFESIARDRLLVLILDDAHRADPSTWELLHYVARTAPRAPLLIVAALRDGAGELGTDLEAAIGVLVQDRLASELRVGPLRREDLGALATRSIGVDATAPTLADWLYERTRGNALLATALLEELASDRPRDEYPRTMRAHVEVLAAGLPPEGRDVLATAAVLGHSFSLAAITHLMSDTAGRWLDELVRRGLLSVRGQGGEATYDFVHPLVQEITYETIGASRRREMHARLAQLLVAEPTAVRAYHAARGALPGEADAIALIWDAAREAERSQAHREALQHLTALRRLLPATSPDRATLLDEVGWQAAEAGEHEMGIDALRELLPLRSDAGERAVVHMRLASLLSSGPGDLASAEREGHAAVSAFTEAGAAEGLASALNELAWIRGEAGDLEEQIAGSRESLERAEALGNETLVLHALGSLGYAHASQGRPESIDILRRSHSIAIARGGRSQTAWHAGTLGLALYCCGRLDEAGRLLDELLDAGPSPSAIPYASRALLSWSLGRWERVLEDQRAVEALHPGEVPAYAAWCASLAGLVEVVMGRDAAGTRDFERGRRLYERSDFYWHGAIHQWAVGSARAIEGDLRGAETHLARAAERAASMGARAIESAMLPDLVEARVDAGDLQGARAASERARVLADGLATVMATAYASYGDGLVHHAEHRTAPARASLQRAADLASSTGMRPLEARSLERLARTFDGAERVRRTTDAARLFAAIGARRQEERVIAELRGLGARGRRSVQTVGALTPREREIVSLVEARLANKEIAERLHLSERTVETHLAHIYSKLGVGGRRELVRD